MTSNTEAMTQAVIMGCRGCRGQEQAASHVRKTVRAGTARRGANLSPEDGGKTVAGLSVTCLVDHGAEKSPACPRTHPGTRAPIYSQTGKKITSVHSRTWGRKGKHPRWGRGAGRGVGGWEGACSDQSWSAG